MLQGLLSAIVTPMNEDGSVDFNSLDRLVEYQVTNQVSGLVILGSTGEFATLSHDERILIINRVIKVNMGRVKIIVGVGFATTVDAGNYVEILNQIDGIDYIMLVTPCYMRPTQHGLLNHFTKVANISKKPVILYNVPSRTGCDLGDDTAIKLANQVDNIIGLKDATGNIARACYLIKNKPKKFMLFSGDDATSMAFMLCGGDGVISVVGNLVPRAMSELFRYCIEGNKKQAININNTIMELYGAMGIESNPIPVKWLLYYKKIIDSPVLRSPLTILSDIYHDDLSCIIEKVI
jgi:4-hydroxy-tetrahydrodipicolinate synthase